MRFNAKQDIDAVRSGGAEDMRKAMNADPSLIADAAQGRTAGAISAMERQAAEVWTLEPI